MRKVYPNRPVEYLEWWITNIDTAGQDCYGKCCLVIQGETIVGCTTVNPVELYAENNRSIYYLQANTILSDEYRGKGLSRQIYGYYNYPNWLTFGFTDIAWKIQPKYVNNFTPIQPVRIYVSVNFKVIAQFFRKLLNNNGKKEENFIMPERIDMGKTEHFVKINSIEQLGVPQGGRWTDDMVELVRDKEYFDKRFFSIYCAKRYGVYKYEKDGKLSGYAVLRKMHYAGFDMVSVVDYRFMDRKDERMAFFAANKLAKKNNVGFVFGMSSRRYGILGNPIMLRAHKILNCAVGTKNNDFNDMLVTSADSDLDFVYYN